MSEESWHQARLIPTSGINGAEEQERRASQDGAEDPPALAATAPAPGPGAED